MTEHSSEHVLVSEWVDGIGFEEVKELDRATRDRFGEIIFRFFFGSLYRNGYSGDPHPGNYRLMPDGRVAFIDFGMTKRVAREDIEAEVARCAAMDGDAAELHRRLGAMGFFDPADEQVTPEAVFEHFHDVTGWYIEDREVTVDRALVAQTLIDFGDPRSRHWQLMRRETMPPRRCWPAAWRRSPSASWASWRPPPTGTGSHANGCSATRPRPSWARSRSPSTRGRRRRPSSRPRA